MTAGRSPITLPGGARLPAHPAGVRVGEADLGGGEPPRPAQPAQLLPLRDGHRLQQGRVRVSAPNRLIGEVVQ